MHPSHGELQRIQVFCLFLVLFLAQIVLPFIHFGSLLLSSCSFHIFCRSVFPEGKIRGQAKCCQHRSWPRTEHAFCNWIWNPSPGRSRSPSPCVPRVFLSHLADQAGSWEPEVCSEGQRKMRLGEVSAPHTEKVTEHWQVFFTAW